MIINIKKNIPFLFLLSALICSSSPLQAQSNSCLECHLEQDDELKAPAEKFKIDVHQNFGLSCTECH